jgi:hypothetical protein
VTYWTEAAIAKHLAGRFYALEQLYGGQFRVVDRNSVQEPEEPALPASRWNDNELALLVEFKRRGMTVAQCSEMLVRSNGAIMDKWQDRAAWMNRVSVPRQQPHLLLDDIARAVCGVYGIGKNDFMSIRRAPRIVEARQVYCWVAKRFTSFSFPQIGRFSNRDHSTVMHGFRKVDGAFDRYRTNIELIAFDLGVSLEEREAA